MNKIHPHPPAGRSTIRIIGGHLRRRRLHLTPFPQLRPTPDYLRETLFNWLHSSITDAHCLDLFAGSGALGIEALSRGAQITVFIEKEIQGVRQLKNNLTQIGISSSHARIVHTCALQWLSQPTISDQFNVVFIDPPYTQQHFITECCQLLHRHQKLTPEAWCCIGMPIKRNLVLPENWQLHRHSHSGIASMHLYRYNAR